MINNSVHFIFDSQHVDAIQTHLYGFYTTEAGVFTQAPSEDEDITDATGAWILVVRNQAGIEITQDFIGCFGLFLFRKGSYWALSNSFNHLLDYLKGRFELSHLLLTSALVYTRYHEKLASIPFEGGRSIPEETLQAAMELNERYPRKAPAHPTTRQIGSTWQAIDVPGARLPGDTSEANEMLMSNRLLEAYESQTVWRNFTEAFDSTPDEWKEPNPAKHHLNGDKYAAVSIAKVIDDVKRGKDACKDYAAFVEACRQELAVAGSARERYGDAASPGKAPNQDDIPTKAPSPQPASATAAKKMARKFKFLLKR